MESVWLNTGTWKTGDVVLLTSEGKNLIFFKNYKPVNRLFVANRRLVQICHNRSLKTKDSDNYYTLLTRP